MNVMKTAEAATSVIRTLRDRIAITYWITISSRRVFRERFSDNDQRRRGRLCQLRPIAASCARNRLAMLGTDVG